MSRNGKKSWLDKRGLSILGLLLLFLGGLGLGWYNHSLLEGSSFPVVPREVLTGQQKRTELEQFLARDVVAAPRHKELDSLLRIEPPKPVARKASVFKAEPEKVEPVVLPELIGVIQVLDPSGETTFRALIGSGDYGVDQQVDGFTIKAISSDGVTLNKKRREWNLAVAGPAAADRSRVN